MNTINLRTRVPPRFSSLLKLTACAAITACAAMPSLAATSFTITLDGLQEVPSFVSPAFGSGTATLNDLGGGNFSLSYSFTMSSNLDWSGVGATASNGGSLLVTNFHVHNQVRGVNGGVVYGMYGPDQDSDADANGNDVVATLNGNNTTTITGNWDPADGAGATVGRN